MKPNTDGDKKKRGKKKRLTQSEHGRDQLVRLAKPLRLQRRRPDVDEAGPGLRGQGLGEHRLPCPGRAEQQDALGLPEQRRAEERRLAERRDDLLVQRHLDVVEAADVVQAPDVQVVVRDDLERDDVLVAVGLDRPRGQAQPARDLLLLVLGGLLRVRVGVELVQGELHDEGRAGEGGREEEELVGGVLGFCGVVVVRGGGEGGAGAAPVGGREREG